MNNQIQQLNIGDEIGFVRLAQHIDESDRVTFFPVTLITERDGETAYRYLYPDGIISGAAIRHSELRPHLVRRAAAPEPEAATGGIPRRFGTRQRESSGSL